MDADVAVVGGGQAGLVMAHALRGAGVRVVVFEAADRLGAAWRSRWDALRLFTPAAYSGLPGMPFPGPGDRHPLKDEVADYLAAYARRFDLPVRKGVRVERLRPTGAGFDVDTSAGRWRVGQVVSATGPFQQPVSPSFAAELDGVVQVHSHDYRNPGQLPAQETTVVVGAGNAGAQIAAELAAAGRRVVVSGRQPPHVAQRIGGHDLFWWLHRLRLLHAPTNSWRGRLLRRRGEPVIGTDLRRLERQRRLRLAPRTVAVRGRRLVFDDGRQVEASAVVWATGYRNAYPWLWPPAVDDDGQPVHSRGVSGVPGLYFVGLPWQSQRASALLDGVGRDAAHLVPVIVARARLMEQTVS
ncbi:flavin-containing monooxygenase [Micromonospora sp. NPDC048935]|uniref:flavin-containing monooxygenase n=1 Tax=Micromonospora sp. NPDC048935 TaxID=3364262 RepID=UPI003724265A